MPRRVTLLISASGVKPKSMRMFFVSGPRRDSTCIERPNSLIRVRRGGLSLPIPQPKCWMSMPSTFLRGAPANWYLAPTTRRETIDLRHRPGDCLSPHWSCAVKQRGDHRAEHGGPAAAEDVTPVHRKIIMIVFDRHDA